MTDKTKKYLRTSGVAIVAGSISGYVCGATESTLTAVVVLIIAVVIGTAAAILIS